MRRASWRAAGVLPAFPRTEASRAVWMNVKPKPSNVSSQRAGESKHHQYTPDARYGEIFSARLRFCSLSPVLRGEGRVRGFLRGPLEIQTGSTSELPLTPALSPEYRGEGGKPRGFSPVSRNRFRWYNFPGSPSLIPYSDCKERNAVEVVPVICSRTFGTAPSAQFQLS